jgi:hypothetical protein
MSRKRIIDFVLYLVVAIAFILLVVALSLSNISESTSRGVITASLTGVCLLVALLQSFERARTRPRFWAILLAALVAHFAIFALLGGTPHALWLMLIVPAEFGGTAVLLVGLIRFGGRVNYVDPVSSSFVEESLQALGGGGISHRRSLVDAADRPVAI